MKTYHYHRIISAFCVILMFAACKQDAPPQFHFEYFGMSEGRYIIYDVMQITHDKALGQHDTLRYQMKTYWGGVYVDNEGREGHEYHIFKRDLSGDPWMMTDVWYGVFDGIRAELVEENIRRVKLVFAPTLSKAWDANAYNLEDQLDCYYRDIHKDTIINNYKFDSTVVVEQEANVNFIDTVRKYEMYAKHVGLIYKHYRDNHYQFGSNEVVNGVELYMTYVSSGWE